MKKEIVIAIVFGLAVGLIITVGMYRARRAMETTTANDVDITETVQPTPEESPLPRDLSSGKLRLREPQPDAFTTEKNLQISGTTVPDSLIVILLNEREVLGSSDTEGNFSIPATLDDGVNVLVIRVLPNGETPIEMTRSIVYDSGTNQTASPSASPVPKKK
jgi:hypothetical protein